MRKLITSLLVVVALLITVGLIRGWFTVSKVDEGTETDINIRIHKERIQDDVDTARDKAHEIGDRIKEAASDAEVVPEP